MLIEGGKSSAEQVRELLVRLKAERRLPTDFELQAVKPELDRLVAKVRRVRALGPEYAEAVELGDGVKGLVKLCEKSSLSLWSRSILKRIAATFLW